MINAIKVAATFIASLPADGLSPETTEGHEGFVHPYTHDRLASSERAVRLIVRDFSTAGPAREGAPARTTWPVARWPRIRARASRSPSKSSTGT